jgi:hypothetical protein
LDDQPKTDQAGPLAEFAALRQEIDQRAERQYKILAMQLTTAGAVFGFALAAPSRTTVLLVIPFSSYLLCSYLSSQARWTVHIAKYMRTNLDRRVPGGFGWEGWLVTNPYPGKRLHGVLRMLLAFPGASAIALASTAEPILGKGLNGPLGLAVIWVIGVIAALLSLTISIQIARLTHILRNQPETVRPEAATAPGAG